MFSKGCLVADPEGRWFESTPASRPKSGRLSASTIISCPFKIARRSLSMRVILTGATGMVGQGVLRECLLSPDVTMVVVVGRSSVYEFAQQDPKPHELLIHDLANL